MQKLISKVLVLGALLVGANVFAAAPAAPVVDALTQAVNAAASNLQAAKDAVKALAKDASADIRKAKNDAVTAAAAVLTQAC